MNRTHSQHADTLPRIRSQGKFARAVTQLGERAKEEEEEPARSEEKRALTRLSSERKTLQSANISKAVRYEATNAIYLRKIEVLEKQSFLLDKEIAAANEGISMLRIKKKTSEDSRTVSSRASQSSKRSHLPTDPQASRCEALRKKVDRESERNRQVQSEIDNARREIATTKRVNEQLASDLRALSRRLEAEAKCAGRLEEELAGRREELKRKKLELIHQKTHLIKNYDLILRKLDEDLAQAPPSESRSINTNLYLTDVYISSKANRRNKDLTENSPRSKKATLQLSHLKERIDQCEQHFQELREATGCDSIEEAIHKLAEGYEQNFSKYRFLNERFSHLQELKEKNATLNSRREELEDTLIACRTSRSACGLLKIQEKISGIEAQKEEIKDKISSCQQLFATLKSFVAEALHRLPLEGLKEKYQIDGLTDLSAVITKDNLQEFLGQILAAKQQLSRKSTKETSLGRSEARSNLEECLQNARREGMQEREKLLGREELMQDRAMGKSKPNRS